jgi:hypothetical protein
MPSAKKATPRGKSPARGARSTTKKSTAKSVTIDDDSDELISSKDLVSSTELADFDLALPESPVGVSNNNRRKSFINRAKNGEFNRHMTFIILSFIFFSFVLGPFLYTTPPRFSAGAGSSGQQCEGEKVNVTRIQTMEDDMKSLYKELNNAIEANIMEKKRALDVVESQKETITRLSLDINALAEKQDRMLDAIQLDVHNDNVISTHSNLESTIATNANINVDGSASVDVDVDENNEHKSSSDGDSNSDSNSNSNKKNIGIIFGSLRRDMSNIAMRIKTLADAEETIGTFNKQAENLAQRSLDIEKFIVDNNTSRLSIDDIVAVSATESGGEAGVVMADSSVTAVSSAAQCPICPTISSLEKIDCPDCNCLQNESNPPSIPDGADYVNLPMVRELVADVVTRKCTDRLKDIKLQHETSLQKFKDNIEQSFKNDTKTNELLQTERAVQLHNARVDFALYSSGAIIDHETTSATFIPPEYDPVKKTRNFLNLVGGFKDSESHANEANNPISGSGGLLAGPIKKILENENLDNYIDSFAQLWGIEQGVGSPEDALKEDMTLGSCWPMAGSSGVLSIKLKSKVAITAISIDHIPKNEAINISSAVKNFRLTGGIDQAMDQRVLVEGSYSIDDGALFSQTFALPARTTPLQYLKFEILSNHGHDDFTCLYRIRVHGGDER